MHTCAERGIFLTYADRGPLGARAFRQIFLGVQMMEGEGVFLDEDSAGDPDAVSAAYDRISDLSRATPFASVPDYIEKVLGRFTDQQVAR